MNVVCRVVLAASVLAVATSAVAEPRQQPAGQQPPQTKPSQQETQKPEEQEPQKYEETVVVSGSKTEEKLINAPVTMTVITADTIENAPTRNFADLLRSMPGLNCNPGLGTRHQRHDAERHRHAGHRSAGAARRPQPLSGLLRLRDVGLPAGQPERDQADRGHPRTGVGCLGRQRVPRRRQRHQQVATRDPGHQRDRRTRHDESLGQRR